MMRHLFPLFALLPEEYAQQPRPLDVSEWIYTRVDSTRGRWSDYGNLTGILGDERKIRSNKIKNQVFPQNASVFDPDLFPALHKSYQSGVKNAEFWP